MAGGKPMGTESKAGGHGSRLPALHQITDLPPPRFQIALFFVFAPQSLGRGQMSTLHQKVEGRLAQSKSNHIVLCSTLSLRFFASNSIIWPETVRSLEQKPLCFNWASMKKNKNKLLSFLKNLHVIPLNLHCVFPLQVWVPQSSARRRIAERNGQDDKILIVQKSRSGSQFQAFLSFTLAPARHTLQRT